MATFVPERWSWEGFFCVDGGGYGRLGGVWSVSEPIGPGEGEDEVEDLRMKSKARTVAAARHAFRKVHMVGGASGCSEKV